MLKAAPSPSSCPRFRKWRVRTSSPTLRAIMEEFSASRTTMRVVSRKIDRSEDAVSKWAKGQTEPGIIDVEIMADLAGYELKLVKKRRPRKTAASSGC